MTMAQSGLKRIIRCCVWILAILVVVFVVSSVGFYALARSATTRWERLASEIRAKGEPLTYAEIEATRPVITDESNGATAIRQAVQTLDAVTYSNRAGVFLLDGECKGDFFEGIERRCVRPSRDYVEARRGGLAKLSTLTHYPHARLNISYEGTIFETSTIALSIATRQRALGKLVGLDAIIKTIDGDTSGAVDAIVLQLRLSEPLYAEPAGILPLVAVAIDSLATRTLEGLLRAHELGDDALSRLEFEWKRHRPHQSLRPFLLGQRASFVYMTDTEQVMTNVHASVAGIHRSPTTSWNLPNPADLIPFKYDWFMLENRVQGVTTLTRLLDVSDDLSNLLEAANHAQDSLPRLVPGRLLVRVVLPSLTRSIESYARVVAQFRSVSVAIAAERFRLLTGRFPDGIDDLVPNYVASVPRDPFDGNPIRLAKNDTGLVVYSVGENKIDDGGDVLPKKGARHGRDSGFRLVEPAQRGLQFKDDATLRDQ